MSGLGKLIRPKRFDLSKENPVELVLESSRGTRLKMTVVNCSLTSLGAKLTGSLPTDEPFDPGMVMPAAKITFAGQEVALGRLILRRVFKEGNDTFLGFSTMDIRVPLDGPLSKHVEGELEDRRTIFDYELSSDKFNLASFAETNHNNVDLFHRTEEFSIFFKQWKTAGKFQYRNIRLASKGERVNLKQSRKGNRNDYLVMGSNDYLGLTTAPEVVEAAKKAIDQYGFGATGSPVSTGLSDLHEELGETVAKIFKKEKVLLYNSGYAANVGAITGLTQPNDFVLADAICHASIQDGMQMSRADCRFFKHNDPTHLEKLLKEHRETHAGALVLTEGVFSMDGDLCVLDKITKVSRDYNCRIMVDEAHSFGVVGPTGKGIWEKYPDAPVDLIMGTFSKICGGIGGFIAADEEVIDWLNFYSRAHIFSVAIPPSTAAAALTALKLFMAKPELVTQLRANVKHFVNGLRELGYPIDPNHESAVIPVIIGDEAKLAKMNEVFRESGVFVIPVIYPAVSRNNCRFRFTMMATHTVSDLDFVLNVIEKAILKAGVTFGQEGAIKAA